MLLTGDDTAELRHDERKWVDEKAGMITNWEEFRRLSLASPRGRRFHSGGTNGPGLPEGMGILGAISGIYEPLSWLMGYETLALALYDQPDLVGAICSRLREIILPAARALVEMDRVIGLWMGDDMGFKTGTLISPRHLRQYVLPIQREVAAIAHGKGMPFVLHSCGNLEGIMDDLIDDVGIDAKHSFEDVIVSVEGFVAQYGSRVGTIGGVDIDLLAAGTEAQVRRRTRQILEACAPSGGYVLGSGNSIANYVPLDRFLAMLDEGHRFNAGL